jgi:hypothetical protein
MSKLVEVNSYNVLNIAKSKKKMAFSTVSNNESILIFIQHILKKWTLFILV